MSWPCFSLLESDRILPQFGVIYTLLLALLAIRLWDADCHMVLKFLGIAALLALSSFGDWAYYDIIYALIAHIFYEKRWLRWGLHTAVALFDIAHLEIRALALHYPWWAFILEFGVLLPPLVLCFLYNGEPGSRKPVHKWVFYIFYPLHMLVLWLLHYRMGL